MVVKGQPLEVTKACDACWSDAWMRPYASDRVPQHTLTYHTPPHKHHGPDMAQQSSHTNFKTYASPCSWSSYATGPHLFERVDLHALPSAPSSPSRRRLPRVVVCPCCRCCCFFAALMALALASAVSRLEVFLLRALAAWALAVGLAAALAERRLVSSDLGR